MYAHSIRGAGLLVTATALFALTVSAPARADTVTDWNAIATTAIVTTAAQSPQASTLSFAMVQGAVYDAVNAIDRGHRPYLVAPRAKRSDSKEAAAATAAFRVLAALFPSQLPTLQPLYDASLAAVPDGRRERGGIAAGDAAAAAMLAARANDGRNGPFTFPIGAEPGAWRPTPPTFALDPAPWVGNVRPFLVPSVAMIRSDPPNPLTSTAYAQDFNEVKQLGALTSTTRTADQTDAAIFWQDHGPALWNRVFAALSASHGLDIVANARLFATENLAAADGAIGCWHSKYHWKFWRPITAIREAESDGNPATTPTRRGRRCSTPPRRNSARRSSRQASPTTRPGTAASAVPSCAPCNVSSVPTRSPSALSATALTPPEATTGPRRRSRRSSTRACGAASTSEPLTSRAQRSATRSPTGSQSTTSRLCAKPHSVRGRSGRPLATRGGGSRGGALTYVGDLAVASGSGVAHASALLNAGHHGCCLVEKGQRRPRYPFHATRARRPSSPAPPAPSSFRARKQASPSSRVRRSPRTISERARRASTHARFRWQCVSRQLAIWDSRNASIPAVSDALNERLRRLLSSRSSRVTSLELVEEAVGRNGCRSGHRGAHDRRTSSGFDERGPAVAGRDRMTIEEVVRRVLREEHGDVIRVSVRVVAQELMEAEVSELIGVAHGERSEDRATHRNGYRARRWDTRAGEIELQIAKIRQGSYFPSFLQPRKRSEQALVSVVQQAYVCGVSTRRVDQLVESLGLRISKSEVSRIAGLLDEQVQAFRERPLEGRYPYLFVDAKVEKVRDGGRVARKCVVIAHAVHETGRREIIGLDVGEAETEAFWTDFLRILVARGLVGVQLAISDAHPGLKVALAQVLGAPWQRCTVHFLRDLRGHVRRDQHDALGAIIRSIFTAPDGEQARRRLRDAVGQLERRLPKIAALLEDAEADVLAFYAFSAEHWPKIRSTNPLERFNREIGRRTDVVGIFPDDASLIRLVSMLAIEANDEWLVGRAYISQKSMATLSDPGAEKEISLDNNDKEVELIAA